KVDTAAYYKVLRYTVLPWLKSTYPSGNYTWTQDGAPCHTSKKVQISVVPTWPISGRRHVAKFESGFKPTRLFCLERLGESCLQDISRNLTSLQQAIVEAWDNLTEEYIKKSCASVRRRVEAVIANNGGHIE
ncbi:Uncharacterized protein FKW44_011373, partial [Caligus rogercresseyi]